MYVVYDENSGDATHYDSNEYEEAVAYAIASKCRIKEEDENSEAEVYIAKVIKRIDWLGMEPKIEVTDVEGE